LYHGGVMGYERDNGFDEVWTLFVCVVFLVVVCVAWAVHGVGRPFVRVFGGSGAAARWDGAFTLD
jgi:hypothetical protein